MEGNKRFTTSPINLNTQNLNHQPQHQNPNTQIQTEPHQTPNQHHATPTPQLTSPTPKPKNLTTKHSLSQNPSNLRHPVLVQFSVPEPSNIRRLLSQKITKVPIEKPPGLLVYRKPKFLADHSLRPHLLQTAVYILDSSVSITIIKNLTDNNRYQNLLIASRVDHSRNF